MFDAYDPLKSYRTAAQRAADDWLLARLKSESVFLRALDTMGQYHLKGGVGDLLPYGLRAVKYSRRAERDRKRTPKPPPTPEERAERRRTRMREYMRTYRNDKA